MKRKMYRSGVTLLLGSAALLGLGGCSSTLNMSSWFPSWGQDEGYFAARQARQDMQATYKLACAYQERGQHQMAIEEFKRVLRQNPKHVPSYNGMGISYDRLGNHGRAVGSYTAALKINPELDYVHNNLGYSHLLQGDPVRAAESFRRAIALNKGNDRYRNNLGVAYAQMGKVQLALAEFESTHKEAAAETPAESAPAVAAAAPAVQPAVQPPPEVAAANISSDPTDPTDRTDRTDPVPAVVKKSAPAPAVAAAAPAPAVAAAKPAANPTDQTDQTDRTDRTDRSDPVPAVVKKSAPAPVVAAAAPAPAVAAAKPAANPTDPTDRTDPVPAAVKKAPPAPAASLAVASARVPAKPAAAPAPQMFSAHGALVLAAVEVANGTGGRGVAAWWSGHLREQGVTVARFTNAPGSAKTRIYYAEGYLQEAYQVAKIIPLYQEFERVPSFEDEEVKIRVVIGRDVLRFTGKEPDRKILLARADI